MRWLAVLLDLDDTLIDRGAAFDRFVATVATPNGRAGAHERELLRRLDREARGDHLRFAATAVAALSLPTTAGQFAADFLEGMAVHATPFPATLGLLQRLATRTRLAIVTNGGSRTQRQKLAVTGLGGLVREVFISAEVGAAKPDGAIFARALAWAEAPASDVLFVGDDPARDIVGAHRMGMATAWVSHGRIFPSSLGVDPTYTLADIAALETLVA